MDHIILVGQAGPLVKVLAVVHITNQALALLGRLQRHRVHRDVHLGLGIVVRLLVKAVVLQLHGPRRQHQLGVILGRRAPDVVAFLLLVRFLVLVLQAQKEVLKEIANLGLISHHFLLLLIKNIFFNVMKYTQLEFRNA